MELYLGVINPHDESGQYARVLFDAFDVDKNGKISLREFLILTVFQVDQQEESPEETNKPEDKANKNEKKQDASSNNHDNNNNNNNSLRINERDEKSFELALALWYSNGNFSQEKLESTQVALNEVRKSNPNLSKDSNSAKNKSNKKKDDDDNIPDDEKLDKDEFRRLVESCKSIIASWKKRKTFIFTINF